MTTIATRVAIVNPIPSSGFTKMTIANTTAAISPAEAAPAFASPGVPLLRTSIRSPKATNESKGQDVAKECTMERWTVALECILKSSGTRRALRGVFGADPISAAVSIRLPDDVRLPLILKLNVNVARPCKHFAEPYLCHTVDLRQ